MDAKTKAAIERLKQNKDLAAQIMRSGDGKQLITMLTQGDGGAALERAAASAAKVSSSKSEATNGSGTCHFPLYLFSALLPSLTAM